MHLEEIIIDGKLPPKSHQASILCEKFDKSGYFWHVLVEEERVTDFEEVAGATKLINQASIDSLTTNLKSAEGKLLHMYSVERKLAFELEAENLDSKG